MSIEVLDKPIETQSGELNLNVYALRKLEDNRRISHEDGATNEVYFAAVTTRTLERHRAYYLLGFGEESSLDKTEVSEITAVIDHETVFKKSVARRMFFDLLPKPFYDRRKERAEDSAVELIRDRIGSFAKAYGGIVISSEQSREVRDHTPAEQSASLHS